VNPPPAYHQRTAFRYYGGYLPLYLL
jgi:hypothetical protein